MKTLHHLALAILLVLTPHLNAAVPAGKPRQPSSPDQVPEGLAKSDWTSIREAYEAGRHAFQPVEGGWQARNPGQQWITKFDGRGFVAHPADGGWLWGLELKSYGFAGQERTITGVPEVKADGQRLTFQWDSSCRSALLTTSVDWSMASRCGNVRRVRLMLRCSLISRCAARWRRRWSRMG